MDIELTTPSTVTALWSEIEPNVVAAPFLEEGAQALVTALYGQFEQQVVLARVFVTVAFADLPEANQQFVRELVDSAGATADLKPTTPVLSLIGTSGQEPAWRDRRSSQGHVGIPLVSSSFVGAIPMISRLLKEFGVPIDWVDSHDSEMVVNAIGSATGLFFVEDAATATDAEGRKIIVAQDFVSDYGVKSVFGVGGAYSTGQIAVLVAFCRSLLSRSVAERFLALGAYFIGETTAHVERGNTFKA